MSDGGPVCALGQGAKQERKCGRGLSAAQIHWGMGGMFENLGTTNKLCEPPRVPFEPPRVRLGLFSVFF